MSGLAAPLAFAATAGSAAPAATGLFLYDATAPGSASCATAARRAGHDAIACPADMAALWHDLDQRLADRPFAISGLTTPAQHFCIAVLASGRRLRPVTSKPFGAHLYWSFAPIGAAA